jgi:hypothetical protein
MGCKIYITTVWRKKEKISTWHDFNRIVIKQTMKDILIFIIVLILGYASFMGIALLLIKLFFPFLSQAELERRNYLISLKETK